MADLHITDEIRRVFDASTITGTSLILPPNLDRKLYQAVNTALEAAGGKWNRKAGAHVFPGDPRKSLGMVLEAGMVVDVKKARQAFYTPANIALAVARYAEVQGHHVLEPSAGHGALADACMDVGATGVSIVEQDQGAYRALSEKRYIGVCGDFLTVRPRKHFQRIVMNPPFTKGQDIAHLKRALLWLDSPGVLVCILPDKGDRWVSEKLNLDSSRYAIEARQLPAGAFKESGTSIRTMMVKITAL